MKFCINRVILNFVINEWNNKDSILFKGINVYQTIFDADNKEKLEKFLIILYITYIII